MGQGQALHLGHGGLLAQERHEALLLQGALDGADAIGPFRVAERGLVVEGGRVADVERRHENSSIRGQPLSQPDERLSMLLRCNTIPLQAMPLYR
jgi:hypothetical protein